MVLAEEELPIDLLEIERKVEGAAHAGVGELRTADVEDVGLHAAGGVDRKLFLYGASVLYRRKIVRRRPVLCGILDPPVDQISLEGFDRNCGIAKIFEAQLSEIIAPDIDVEVLAPIVHNPLID